MKIKVIKTKLIEDAIERFSNNFNESEYMGTEDLNDLILELISVRDNSREILLDDEDIENLSKNTVSFIV